QESFDFLEGHSGHAICMLHFRKCEEAINRKVVDLLAGIVGVGLAISVDRTRPGRHDWPPSWPGQDVPPRINLTGLTVLLRALHNARQQSRPQPFGLVFWCFATNSSKTCPMSWLSVTEPGCAFALNSSAIRASVAATAGETLPQTVTLRASPCE